MQASKVPSKDTQSKLAERIRELSSINLSKKENRSYFALKSDDGPYSSIVTVRWHKNSVSFHMPSSDLVGQAKAAGFSPENRQSSRPFFKHKRYFYGLTLTDIQKHEPLFRAIVKDSLEYVISQRPRKK